MKSDIVTLNWLLFDNFVFCVHIHLLLWLLCVDSCLPVDELISPKDIDPIHRYVPRQDQRNVSMRYSNQVSSWQPCRGSLRCSSRHCKEEGQIIRVDTFSRASFIVRTASGLQVLHFKKYIYSIVLLLLTIYAVFLRTTAGLLPSKFTSTWFLFKFAISANRIYLFLESYGHVQRRDIKGMLQIELPGRKATGRPKMRFRSVVR